MYGKSAMFVDVTYLKIENKFAAMWNILAFSVWWQWMV